VESSARICTVPMLLFPDLAETVNSTPPFGVVEDFARPEAEDHDFIVRMRNHHQDVGLVARVAWAVVEKVAVWLCIGCILGQCRMRADRGRRGGGYEAGLT
jgi:hypothetical protein